MPIDIIITAKDNQASLDLMLDSAMKVKNAHIYVIDDGSKEPLSVNCSKKVDLIRNSVNRGYGASMNRLIDTCCAESSNEYVALAESDDRIDWYDMNDVLAKPHGSDIVKCSYHARFDEKDTYHQPVSTMQMGKTRQLDKKDILPLIDHHHAIWSALYKKSFLKSNDIRFIEAPGAGWVDIPFNYEVMLKAKTIEWDRLQVYYYTLHNGDNSSTSFKASLPFERMLDVSAILHSNASTEAVDLRLFTVAYARAVLKYIDMCFRLYHKVDEYEACKPIIEECLSKANFDQHIRLSKFEKAILTCWQKDGNVDEWVISVI